ncbi:MAG TPA: hypothetical protein PKE19_00050 [Aestuariivirga sp.]|nr:hypothetical protein [Aestuariivirga sp.]
MPHIAEIIRKTGSEYKPMRAHNDGREWLAGLLNKARQSPGRIYSGIEIINPSRAEALLNVNPGNRALSTKAIEDYAEDMAAGRWAVNGEAIVISDTGELNDGQHRCEAVITADVSIQALVVCGVSRASRTTTDMGKIRRVGDLAHMLGVPDAITVSAAATLLMAIEDETISNSMRDGRVNSARPTRQEVLKFITANLEDIRRAMGALNASKCVKVGSFSRMAACLAALARATGDFNGAAAYVRDVSEGENLSRNNPAYVVRERLIAEKQSRKLTSGMTVEALIRGWNYRRARTVTRRLTLTGSVPEIAR